jgi:hypothetical protein
MLRLKTCIAAFLAGMTLACAAAAPAWKLRPEGFGPLKIGMRFDEARRAGGRGIKPTPPPQVNPQCDQVRLPGHPGVALMFVDGVLRRVDVFGAGVRTASGIAVGDALAKVERAYPALVRSPNAYDENEAYLTVGPAQGRALRFETLKGKVGRIYAGDWAQVQYVEGCL